MVDRSKGLPPSLPKFFIFAWVLLCKWCVLTFTAWLGERNKRKWNANERIYKPIFNLFKLSVIKENGTYMYIYIVMVFKTIQTNWTHVKSIYIVIGLFTLSRDNISFNREQFLKNSQAVILVENAVKFICPTWHKRQSTFFACYIY